MPTFCGPASRSLCTGVCLCVFALLCVLLFVQQMVGWVCNFLCLQHTPCAFQVCMHANCRSMQHAVGASIWGAGAFTATVAVTTQAGLTVFHVLSSLECMHKLVCIALYYR